MRLSIERLRWGLLAAALLLIAVIASLLAYGRYRAVKAWRQIVAHSGATVTHEAHEVTYSQAVGGRTVFTIHAADAMPHGDGKYMLRNVVLLLYGPNGTRVDRVSGAEFDYDQKNEIARAIGEVHMDLQAPSALSTAHDEHAPKPQNAGATGEVAETPQTIHVRTSGLVYMRKMGIASTDQEVEIAYQGFQGYARGAEFNADESTVHLLADVRVQGQLRDQPAQLTAAKADLERDTNLIRLTQPRVRSGSGSAARDAAASLATLHLRKDGSVQLVEARGGVELHSGTQTLRTASLNATMNERSLLSRAELTGGVQMDDTDPSRRMHGTVHGMTVLCNSDGNAQSIVAQGAVNATAEDRRGSTPLHRQIMADRLTVNMRRSAHGAAQEVASIAATGAASVHAEALTASSKQHPQIKTTQISGDTLNLSFVQTAAGKNLPNILTASGNTKIDQKTPDGAEQTSTGDSLAVHFAEATRASRKDDHPSVQIATAEQTGHVKLRSERPATGKGPSQATEATAGRALYESAADRITLTGHPEIQQGGTSLAGSSIVLSQQSGDAVAHGDVAGTLAQADSPPGNPVTHVVAQDAVFNRASQTASFRGTDTHPARIWHGASQIEAADLLVDDLHKTLTARPAQPGGLVHTVFAGTEKTNPSKRAKNDVLSITSTHFDYSETTRTAIFLGDVHAQNDTNKAEGNRAVVFLNPPAINNKASQSNVNALNGSVQKIVLSGDVKITSPGRSGTGDQLLYTAQNQQFVLTGRPSHLPRITDEKQGNITGTTLLFSAADSTIVVAGEPGAHGEGRGRVHTETVVKP